MLSLFFISCSSTTMVQGTVFDIWNQPVSGVQVHMENVDSPTQSSSTGAFSFEATEGVMRFRAQKDGFMPGIAEKKYAEGDEDLTVEIKLYPLAKENGVWFVGDSSYTSIPKSSIVAVENHDAHITGIKSVGKNKLDKPKPSFIFRTSMSKEELKQIDLELHQLQFQEKTTFDTITGPTDVELDIWTAGDQKSFTIREMQIEDHFLIELSDPLSKGAYAFHSHNTLNNETSNKRTLPKELMFAYPFRIK